MSQSITSCQPPSSAVCEGREQVVLLTISLPPQISLQFPTDWSFLLLHTSLLPFSPPSSTPTILYSLPFLPSSFLPLFFFSTFLHLPLLHSHQSPYWPPSFTGNKATANSSISRCLPSHSPQWLSLLSQAEDDVTVRGQPATPQPGNRAR